MSKPNVSESLVHDAHCPRLLYLPSSDLRCDPRGQTGVHSCDIRLATGRSKHGYTTGFNSHLPTVSKPILLISDQAVLTWNLPRDIF